MSQTLYRKYRSQRFADIIGQSSVVRVLQNSIVRGRLNHAYLFSGPRGTGKTSIARIFAKALNCLDPQDGDACGTCEVCKAIAAGNAVDVIEIDAASNRGIDDIRDLRERVNYAPLELKRKVYIVDEVHMITGPAWNALLKTLEEPPSHVIFCLCTTEANKVPITILSRCIRFDFQRLPHDALAAHLDSIASTEGFTLEPGSALKLAKLAEGSARDAISLLDQLTVFCDSVITSGEIDELFQLGDPAHLREIVDSLLSGQAGAALQAWEEMLARGVDAGTFLLQLSEELKTRYLDEANPRTKHALDAVWQGLNLLKYDNFPALLVELTLIEASGSGQQASAPARRTEVTQPTSQGVAPVASRTAESRFVTAPVTAEQVTQVSSRQPDEIERAPEKASSAPPQTVGESELIEAYRQRVHDLRLTTFVLLQRGVTAALQDNRLILSFDEDCRQALAYAGSDDNMGVLREAARQMFGQHTVIELCRAGHAVSEQSPAEKGEERTTQNGSSTVEALESVETNGAGADRPATFDDVIRLFGAGEVAE